MTMGHHHPTATILLFPSRGRVTGKSGFAANAVAKPNAADATRVARPAFADSWYHQAAIEEAAHTRKP